MKFLFVTRFVRFRLAFPREELAMDAQKPTA
jgi:hypothetical protein